MNDVVVVGGGPAGALTALILARGGARVRVFDRARFPRAKLCGDTLNPGALRILERHVSLMPLWNHSVRVDGMILTGPRRVTVHGRYDNGVTGRAITRHHFDQWLLDEARSVGVEVEEGCAVCDAIIDSTTSEVTGVTVRGGHGPVAHPARLVIAADGRHSHLAFALGLARHPAWPRRWAIGGYFESVSAMSTLGEMHVRSGHYIGIAPVPGGLTNVCLVVPCASGGPRVPDPAAHLRAMVDRDDDLRQRFAAARLRDKPSVLGPMAVDVRTPGIPGLLLAGDAAGFIDPITGDGLRLALHSAELTAAVALDVLAGRVTPRQAVDNLAHARHQAFQTKRLFNRGIRRLVASPRGIGAAAAIARVAPDVFQFMIRYAGDATLTHDRFARSVCRPARDGGRGGVVGSQ